jgi:hypothetical protein
VPPADAPAADAPLPPRAAETTTPVRPARKEAGLFSIDSQPYATIFVDGHSLGFTPISQRPLAAGRHRVRAVLPDGRVQERTVDVPSGKEAAPIHLSW